MRQVLRFGQFDVQPLHNADAGQELDRLRRGSPEKELEGGIIVLHINGRVKDTGSQLRWGRA